MIARLILLKMRNISDKRCKEKTHFMCNYFSRISCLLWDNVEKYGRPERTQITL